MATGAADTCLPVSVNRSGGIKAIIFDMDNTLFDFVEAKIAACRAVAHALGGDAEELLRYFARDPTKFEGHANIADYMADRGLYDEGRYSEMCALYERVKLESVSPYPGIREALSSFKEMGLKLGVATNSTQANALARLERTGLIVYFDAVVAARSMDEMKPKPDLIKRALEALEVSPGEAIMVGDSLSRDITAGRSLGMLTAYAVYGDRNISEARTEIAPDYFLRSAYDLVPMLGKIDLGLCVCPRPSLETMDPPPDPWLGISRDLGWQPDMGPEMQEGNREG